jgi:hypothetical protein
MPYRRTQHHDGIPRSDPIDGDGGRLHPVNTGRSPLMNNVISTSAETLGKRLRNDRASCNCIRHSASALLRVASDAPRCARRRTRRPALPNGMFRVATASVMERASTGSTAPVAGECQGTVGKGRFSVVLSSEETDPPQLHNRAISDRETMKPCVPPGKIECSPGRAKWIRPPGPVSLQHGQESLSLTTGEPIKPTAAPQMMLGMRKPPQGTASPARKIPLSVPWRHGTRFVPSGTTPTGWEHRLGADSSEQSGEHVGREMCLQAGTPFSRCRRWGKPSDHTDPPMWPIPCPCRCV